MVLFMMLEFLVGDEEKIVNNSNNTPTTAFVIVESKNGYMLLYNKYRNKWELTGGYIEQDESPKEGAIRECLEESNQNISDLYFVGLAKYTNMNAAIYYAFLKAENPFIENDEIKELQWWRPGDEIGEICSDSIRFIRLHNP